MANTLVTYTATTAVGPTPVAQALAAMKLIPLDLTLTRIWGLLPVTDTINAVSTTITRGVATQMTPTIADAAGTANLTGAGTSGGAVGSVTMTNQGGLYAAPPVVTFTGGTPTAPAQGIALCQVRGCIALLGGSGYSGATVCQFVGPLAPGGVQATGTVTVVGNAVTGIVMTNTGGPYLQAPSVVITDSGGGTGAEVVAGLSVLSVQINYGGTGYQTAPNVIFTPLFKQMVPDSAGNSNQGATLEGWMDATFQQLLKMPVQSAIAVS